MGSKLKVVTIKIPEELVEQLDKLVESGFFASRSEAIRLALRDLIERRKYMNRIIEEQRKGIRYIGAW